ncbi:MAG: hypothetical protein U0802_21370 [Candidatus Binatia bacterium]
MRSAKFLVKAPFILAMLFVINLMTSPHHRWVAAGAWPRHRQFALLRVIRAVVLAGLAALGAVLLKRR